MQSSAFRIFATPAAPGSPRSTAARTTPPPLRIVETVASVGDRALLAVLARPARPDQTAEQCFAAKERELERMFDQLSVIECRALHLRFANPRTGDALAARFRVLVPARQVRLLTYLADARRRETVRAIAAAAAAR